MSYAPHERLIAPARNGREGPLWTLLGLGVVVLMGYALTVALYQSITPILSERDPIGFDAHLTNGTRPDTLLLMLASFGLFIFATRAALRLVQRRSLRSVLGSEAWPQFRTVMIAVALLHAVVFILPPWDILDGTEAGLRPGLWLALLPLSLIGVLLQVSAEEIVFRGFLQQQLAARYASPLVWLIAPSVIFAIGHYDPSNGDNAWLIVIWAGLFGIALADLTARTGSLGPAIAIHFVNNVIGILIVSPGEYLSGLALYVYPYGMENEAIMRVWLPIDLMMMLVMWLAARLALRA